jgi:ligand-binding SRPBCC domain-containing protein
MIYRHTFTVQASLAEVTHFHTQASSLRAITPPLMPMRLHYAPEQMNDGDTMSFTMWLGPVPVHWKAEVDQVSDTGFVDRQVDGPFASWTHRHAFESVDANTTRVVDRVEAVVQRHALWGTVGLGMWLGLPVLFAYRGWKTRRLLETSDAPDGPQ